MKNNNIKAFWIGFVFTSALTAWIYWLWRQKRVVAPEPLVVSQRKTPPVAQTDRAKMGKEPAVVSEALEEINGIGPVFANRLNEAGIFTFAQLAGTPPDEIAGITGVTRWDPSEWIAEAEELARIEEAFNGDSGR